MIHIVTISELPGLVVQQVCRHLFLCYSVGAECSSHQPQSGGAEGLDAAELLARLAPFSSFADDKTLFLTDAPLVLPPGPLGTAPSGGYSDPSRGVAVVTSHGIDLPQTKDQVEDETAWMAFAAKVGRRSVQQVGFLWGLHRCVDLRCAMAPPWLGDTAPTLCDFCREHSEATIHLARS